MDFLVKYGMVACFVSLVMTSFGWPVPEEISLLGIGVLVNKGTHSCVVGWIVGFIGVTAGDVIAWFMGRRVGLEPKGFVSKLIGKEQIQEIEQFYRRWGDWAIAIARQVPGMRFPTFFFSGASAVPFGRFYLIDGAAALITVNVYFWLGYNFGDDVEEKIIPWIKEFKFYASSIAMLLFAIIIIRIIRKRLRQSNS